MSKLTPTPEQERILAHAPSQHARILAGPGTGKSATMVMWIEKLLSVPDEPPRIKLLTFTRAATGELAKKIEKHPHLASEKPGTIHSFSISILLQNEGVGGFPEPLRIADDWENDKVIYPTLSRRIGVTASNVRRLFAELASGFESLAEDEDEKVDEKDRRRFLGGWQEHKNIFGYTLLSELPYALRNALRDHPDLEGVSYDALIVDEYQDLNACDLEVLRLIGDRGVAIVGVGDDDQSIYGFRKAHPEGIRRFLDDYEDGADYPLSITHRCGSKIVSWASFVIEQDLSRSPDKRRISPAKGSPPGEVALLSFRGHRAEAAGIASLVYKLVNEEGIDPKQVLVLLRSDRHGHFSGPIKEELEDKGIPTSNPEYVNEVLSEPDNRTVLAKLRLLHNLEDSLAWASLFTLARGIGKTFIDYVYDQARQERATFGATVIRLANAGFADGPRGSSDKAAELVSEVLDWVADHEAPTEPPEDGWAAWVATVLPNASAELLVLLLGIEELVDESADLNRYLGQVRPLAKDVAQNEAEGVRIMTMASSKGLTVEATIVGSLEEGVIPRPDCDRDEERRLLYVALTRAKRFVFATWARRRTGPTARAGRSRVRHRRTLTTFLAGGPVTSEDGNFFIGERWPS